MIMIIMIVIIERKQSFLMSKDQDNGSFPVDGTARDPSAPQLLTAG